MALVAEFTVEPFVGGEPGPHVRAALAAAKDAAAGSGLRVEFGPFGTVVAGEDTAVLDAVDAVVRSAVAAGATRLSLQVARPDGAAPAGRAPGARAVSRLDDNPSTS